MQPTDKEKLFSIIHQHYGNEYSIKLYRMDSLIGKVRDPSTPAYEDITDPYYQLNGVIVFCAYLPPEAYPNQDCSILGIYQDGMVQWSVPFFLPGLMTDIFSASDLNNDGSVDMVTLWSGFAPNITTIQYIWIVSWDGKTGTLINDYDSKTHISTLLTTAGKLQVINPNRDETWELRAYWSPGIKDFPVSPIPTRPFVTYGWNGTAYGLWQSTRQVPGEEFLPADLLQADVGCRVALKNDTLRYSYKWINLPTSKQKIQAIYLANVAPGARAQCIEPWLTQTDPRIHGISWNVWDINTESMIKPGDSSDKFGVHSKGLPTITRYYIQGYRPPPESDIPGKITEQMVNDDILNNSTTGFTIGPRSPLSPFNGFRFLDSLDACIKQSFALGWIKNKATSTKYLKLTYYARFAVRQRNSKALKKILDDVFKGLKTDQATLLSPEAYSIIYYNAMYLKRQTL